MELGLEFRFRVRRSCLVMQKQKVPLPMALALHSKQTFVHATISLGLKEAEMKRNNFIHNFTRERELGAISLSNAKSESGN